MTRISSAKSYFYSSRSALYSLIILTPLLAIYLGMRFILFAGKDYALDNSAFAMLRKWIYSGPVRMDLLATLIIGALIVWLLLWNRRNHEARFSGSISVAVLTTMLLESAFWATVLLLIPAFGAHLFMAVPLSPNSLEMIYLSIGAGLFEEFLFRFLLVSGLMLILPRLFDRSRWHAGAAAVIISGIIFAGFHYIGPFGELFRWRTFVMRFTMGSLLSLLFLFRGLGITSCTHIFYDIALIGIPMTIQG